jgi:hypothetical protein
MQVTSFIKSNDDIYRFEPCASGLSLGVIGKSANSVDYSLDSLQVRAAEKELIEKLTGIRKKNILMMDQMHGDAILPVNVTPEEESPEEPEADGLMTPLQGICLVIRSADCVPVFIYDRKRRILGAVHSGWRGTERSVARKLARLMKESYRSAYQDMLAWILPSVGPESYEVGKEVASLFPRDISERNGRLYLDLWQNIERSLKEEGVPAENIVNHRISTLVRRSEFFSYRGGDRGRNLNFGYMDII